MGKNFIVGIDSGTSGIKAVAFDLDGNEQAKHLIELTAICPYENWFEEDMMEIYDKMKICLGEVARKVGPENISGIGITAQGDGLWMMDKDGNPIRNGMCFCDGRSGDIVDEWYADGTVDKTFDICGSACFTGTQSTIVEWMKRNEPQNWAKTAVAFHLKDWLFYKLTGLITTDESDESLPMLNMATRQYDDRLFEFFRMSGDRDKYPEVKMSHENKGNILPAMASELGLREDVLITSGPMDVSACALGAGVVEGGHACSIIGTAAIHEMVMNTPELVPRLVGLTVCHAMDERWLRLMPSLAGTPNLDWAVDNLAKDYETQAKAAGKNVYDFIEEKVKAVPVGAKGVMYHPYLLSGGERAPFVKPSARASFTGLNVTHTTAEILRAVYEGVAFAMLDCYSHMAIQPERITLCGGGKKSALWCQIFADATGAEIVTTTGEELGALGVVMTNGVAQGLYKDYAEAVAKAVRPDKSYKPNPDNHKLYKKYYELYKATYTALMSTWDLRNKLFAE